MILQDVHEITVGNWIVVGLPLEQSKTLEKNYIVQITKITKGGIYGSFLKSKFTKKFTGFVYVKPDIEDIYKFTFSQIKKIITPPQVYLRSMYLFRGLHATQLCFIN